MRKCRIILVGLLMILIAMGFCLNTIAQNNSEKKTEIPDILQLNPSLDFDKEAIKEWVEDHSWEKANELAKEATRVEIEEASRSVSAAVVTPLDLWVQANYKGRMRFWSEEDIKEHYRKRLEDLKNLIYIFFRTTTPDESGVMIDNFDFVLEDSKGNRFNPEKIKGREIDKRTVLGTTYYNRVIEIYFPSDQKLSSLSEITFYAIRKGDILQRDEFKWNLDEEKSL